MGVQRINSGILVGKIIIFRKLAESGNLIRNIKHFIMSGIFIRFFKLAITTSITKK